jgi:predicted  nucleic acid-binding Zn-ribbon protein
MEKPLVQRLRGLFVLQKIDIQLDEIDAEKGDLPEQVLRLEEKLNNHKTQIQHLRDNSKAWKVERDKADVDILTFDEKIEKLKNQQFQVRSNKEYDALTKEITHVENQIEKQKKQMTELEGRMQVAKEDIDKLEKELNDVEGELKEKRKELEEVSAINEDEESKLQHERDKILARIEKADLAMYERIRKAKGGLAVVQVRRGSCGGCHNRIPPQRLLELRQHEKLFKCEHCGRILVSDEVANTATMVS